MRIKSFGAAALVAGLCIALSSMSAFAAKPRTVRGELVHKIVLKWGAHVQEAYKANVGEWARAMTPALLKADVDTLRKAAEARTFDAMNDTLLGEAAPKASAAGLVTGASLGSPIDDLVLVPVSPCRLFDTRLAGGAIAGNTTRDFDVTVVGDYSFQGGSATDCGGVGSSGSFAAAVINFTVVSPTGGGYITAFPLNTTRPLASTVNFQTGDIKGNLAVVKLDQGGDANELSIYAFAQTHVVADIVGYFIAPMPTALECQDTANTVTNVAAGGTANVLAPNCPAGFTQTATNCESQSWDMPMVLQHAGVCSAKNNSGVAADLRASRTCCRVPGR